MFADPIEVPSLSFKQIQNFRHSDFNLPLLPMPPLRLFCQTLLMPGPGYIDSGNAGARFGSVK